jgi:hypothetical protein
LHRLAETGKAQPPANTDVKAAVVAVITAFTVLTAGLWAAVLIDQKIDDDGAVDMLLFILTFTCLGILILAGAVMRESRQQKRSGGQLPPSTPRADVASQRHRPPPRPNSPQINPGQQHAAEAQRSRLPARHRPARRHRIDGAL